MQDGDGGGRLEICAVCNALVIGWTEGNTVCEACGMTLVEPPFEGSDYFHMLMRPGHLGHVARRRPPR